MFVFLIFCHSWISGSEATLSVGFQVVNQSSVVKIPGASAIARDIGASNSDYRVSAQNISPGDKAPVRQQPHQQFHGIAHDSQGNYYTGSILAHMCEIREITHDFFYEEIPREFSEGAVAFIPCLADGVPSPTKTLQRCDSEECGSVTEVKDGLVSHDGHVIYERATLDQMGWYRCLATNMCGSVETAPIFINIRKGESSAPRPGYLVSRRTEEFNISYQKDQTLDNSETHLERKVTPYELWRMNTTRPSFSDEVVFLEAIQDDTEKIYLFYYPYHSEYGNSEELSHSGEIDGHLHYGTVTHNNSYITHFSKLSFVAQFDTEFINPPDIRPPEDEIFDSPSKIDLLFHISNDIPKKYAEDSGNFVCFKDTIKLESSSWKSLVIPPPTTDTSLPLTLTLTLLSPISRDSGYYQCGVQYDVLYLSRETFLQVDSPQDFFHPSVANVTSTSAMLQWGAPPGYTGGFVVRVLAEGKQQPLSDVSSRVAGVRSFIYDPAAGINTHKHSSLLPSPNNSLPLTNLTPYNQYTWFVETESQQPVTDPRTFTTLKDAPAANVGLLSVLSSETSLQVSWTEFPVSSWYDDRIYFTVATHKVNGTDQGVVSSTESPLDREEYTSRTMQTPEGTTQTTFTDQSTRQTTHVNTASVSGLEPATTYTITVTVCNSAGCSGNHSNVNVTTQHSVLETSPELHILYTSQTFIEITALFNDTSTDDVYLEMFSGADLCRFASPIPSTPLLHLKTGSRDRIDQLTSFTDYSLRARATNGYSTSPWSPCVDFKTKFSWWLPVIPVVVVSVLLILVMVIRAVIRSRCPDVISKVKQALEPRYVNIHHPVDDWETSNEVAIIHTAFEDCEV